MKINRQEFIQALKQVSPGLANNAFIEGTDHFMFNNDFIYAFNDEITITKTFITKVNGSVNGPSLLKLLEKLKEEDVFISQEKNNLKIVSGRTEANLKLIPDIKIELPFKTSELNKWRKLPTNFIEALSFCIFSAATNDNRECFNCLFITEDNIIACDNLRVTKYNLDSKIKEPFLIPKNSVQHLIKYNPIKYSLETDGWVHFIDNDQVVFSARTVVNDFPDITDLFNIEGKRIRLPKEFAEAVSRADILVTADFDQDRYITVIVDKNTITCKGSGIHGTIKETMKQEYTGDILKFTAHPTHLQDILNRVQSTKVGEDKLLFSGKNFKHVISLIGE